MLVKNAQRELEQEKAIYEQILQHKKQKEREVVELQNQRKKDAAFAITSVQVTQ